MHNVPLVSGVQFGDRPHLLRVGNFNKGNNSAGEARLVI